MVEKYKGVLPPGSIWFHLTGDEARALIEVHPDIKTQLPTDKQLAEIDDVDIQALPAKTEDIEKLLHAAGLNIVTLFD